jgi:hypothetical protein
VGASRAQASASRPAAEAGWSSGITTPRSCPAT